MLFVSDVICHDTHSLIISFGYHTSHCLNKILCNAVRASCACKFSLHDLITSQFAFRAAMVPCDLCSSGDIGLLFGFEFASFVMDPGGIDIILGAFRIEVPQANSDRKTRYMLNGDVVMRLAGSVYFKLSKTDSGCRRLLAARCSIGES